MLTNLRLALNNSNLNEINLFGFIWINLYIYDSERLTSNGYMNWQRPMPIFKDFKLDSDKVENLHLYFLLSY